MSEQEADDTKTDKMPTVEQGATQRLDRDVLQAMSNEEMPKRPHSIDGAKKTDAPADSESSAPEAEAKESKVEEEPFVVEHAGTAEADAVKDEVVAILKTVFDPEIPVNIYELGMVYDIFVDGDARTLVRMTLTSPNCPVAGTLPGEVEEKVKSVESVSDATVTLVWDPPWSPDFMTEAAKLQLNMF
jgi:FeS assembly SUF system protein